MKDLQFSEIISSLFEGMNRQIWIMVPLFCSTFSYADGLRCTLDDFSIVCVLGNVALAATVMVPTFLIITLLLAFVKRLRKTPLPLITFVFIFLLNFINLKFFNPLPEEVGIFSFRFAVVGSLGLQCIFILFLISADKKNWTEKISAPVAILMLLFLLSIFCFFFYLRVMTYLDKQVGTLIKVNQDICLSVNNASCNFTDNSTSGTVRCLNGFELKFETLNGVRHVGGSGRNSFGYEESSKVENGMRTRVIEFQDHKSSLVVISNRREPFGWGSDLIGSCDLIISRIHNVLTHVPERLQPKDLMQKVYPSALPIPTSSIK